VTEDTERPKLPLSYTQLAEMEPKAAVLLMFTHLEGLLKRSFKREYPDEKRPGTMAALSQKLVEKRVIDAGLKARLDDLRARDGTASTTKILG